MRRPARRLRRNRVQPYKRGTGRQAGAVLYAQLRGRTAYGQNPADRMRAIKRKRRRTRRRRYPR